MTKLSGTKERRLRIMKIRCIILIIVVTVLMSFSQPAITDDLADLKAAHQAFVKAWNTADVTGAFEYRQDGGIWLPDSQAFPVVTNSALGIQIFTKFLETHIYRYSWYKVDYRVIGDTGFVWGVRTKSVIVKATGTGKRTFLKTSMVFMKSEGKWKAVMLHDTPIPSEVDIF
jgi:ketosteroid isomerase-like protein